MADNKMTAHTQLTLAVSIYKLLEKEEKRCVTTNELNCSEGVLKQVQESWSQLFKGTSKPMLKNIQFIITQKGVMWWDDGFLINPIITSFIRSFIKK